MYVNAYIQFQQEIVHNNIVKGSTWIIHNNIYNVLRLPQDVFTSSWVTQLCTRLRMLSPTTDTPPIRCLKIQNQTKSDYSAKVAHSRATWTTMRSQAAHADLYGLRWCLLFPFLKQLSERLRERKESRGMGVNAFYRLTFSLFPVAQPRCTDWMLKSRLKWILWASCVKPHTVHAVSPSICPSSRWVKSKGNV